MDILLGISMAAFALACVIDIINSIIHRRFLRQWQIEQKRLDTEVRLAQSEFLTVASELLRPAKKE